MKNSFIATFLVALCDLGKLLRDSVDPAIYTSAYTDVTGEASVGGNDSFLADCAASSRDVRYVTLGLADALSAILPSHFDLSKF